MPESGWPSAFNTRPLMLKVVGLATLMMTESRATPPFMSLTVTST